MKYFCLLTILIFQVLGLKAQLVTSNTMTPTQLVTQVLLGPGVTANNITFTDYRNDWKPDMSSGTYFYVLNLQDGRKYNGFFELFN